MIQLPAQLAAVIKSGDLRTLKVFCEIYRNKWDANTNAYALEQTPVDISKYLVKCANLTTKLDVAEVTEYTASNITLAFSNVHNEFAEDISTGFFPEGYQIYGSRVSLFVGTSATNRTPLFNGVISSLPRYRPENYQVEVTVVSVLELLDDVEAKGFSNPVNGETLTLDHTESNGNPVYKTSNTGVGGFNAIYANGTKINEGTDYKVDQVNEYLLPALVEIINDSFKSATITADYYVWKHSLKVEEVVNGVLDVYKWPYDRDIQPAHWNTSRKETKETNFLTLGFYEQNETFVQSWLNARNGRWQDTTARDENTYIRRSILPENWETEFTIRLDDLSGDTQGFNASYAIGNDPTGSKYYKLKNALVIACLRRDYLNPRHLMLAIGFASGGSISSFIYESSVVGPVSYLETPCKVRKIGNKWEVYLNGQLLVSTTRNIAVNCESMYGSSHQRWSNLNQVWRILNDDGSVRFDNITDPSILSSVNALGISGQWGAIRGQANGTGRYALQVYFSPDGTNFDNGTLYDLNEPIARTDPFMRFVLKTSSTPGTYLNFSDMIVYVTTDTFYINYVDLSGKSVLDVIKDLSLITGYEFGVNRQNVFFFRPRQTINIPVYLLDEKELVKIDTVGKDLKNVFTKITLDFDETPLEFYANTGTRPTPVDKYGIINKEISRPQLINYNNAELAQAIGPQLLAIYANLTNQITATAKINLALDLGDVVNLQRELPLTVNPAFSDYTKYEQLNTFYRACKIIGLTYDFTKWQVKYTLQDVGSKNTEPLRDYYQYQTIFPTPLDYKE